MTYFLNDLKGKFFVYEVWISRQKQPKKHFTPVLLFLTVHFSFDGCLDKRVPIPLNNYLFRVTALITKTQEGHQ